MRMRIFQTLRKTGLMLGGLGLFLASPALRADDTSLPYESEAAASDNVAPRTLEAEPVSTTNAEGEAAAATPAPESCNSCNNGCGSGCGNGCGGCGSCNLGEPWTLMGALCSDECPPPFKIGGWSQWGYSSRSDNVMNTHPDHLDAQQQWIYIEKIADGSNGVGFGFRADLMYGTDAQNTQAFGNPPGSWDFQNGWDHGVYGWAMPQLYAEVASGNLSVKLGHFYTYQGYEVFGAPGNFFYSHAFTWNFSEPFTHTGVMANYKVSDNVTAMAGWTAGLDTGFDRTDDGSNFHGGATVKLNDKQTLTYMTCIGDFGARGEGYLHSIIFDTAINDNWQNVIESDLVETNFGGDHQYSLVDYLFYKINDCYKVGTRAEWWHASGQSVYEITGGLNAKVHANVIVRPEVRYQWTANDTAAVNNFGITTDEQVIFGVDAIVTF